VSRYLQEPVGVEAVPWGGTVEPKGKHPSAGGMRVRFLQSLLGIRHHWGGRHTPSYDAKPRNVRSWLANGGVLSSTVLLSITVAITGAKPVRGEIPRCYHTIKVWRVVPHLEGRRSEGSDTSQLLAEYGSGTKPTDKTPAGKSFALVSP
jgi:hypothetical protein